MVATALILHVGFFAAIVLFVSARGFLNIYSGLFTYTAFHLMAFVQRPINVYLFDLRSVFEGLRYLPTDGEFVHTLFVADLGYLSFVLCYMAAIRFTPLAPNFSLPETTYNNRYALTIIFVLLAPLILYSFFLVFTMRQAYGAEALDELAQLNLRIDPVTGNTVYVDSSAYIIEGHNFALPFAALLVIWQRGRLWSWLPLLFCALAALQVGSRWPLLISAVMLLLLTSYLRSRRTFELKHYVFMGIVLFVFVAVGHNRETLIKFLLSGELDLDFDLSNSSFGNHPDFAMFDCLSFVLAKVPDVSRTYSYFTQYLGLITQPVPRALWPDKPVGSPILWVNLDSYGNFTPNLPTLVGDGWISLGYAGVIITTGAVGALYGWLYKKFCDKAPSIYFFCTYFWMLALLVQWGRDGGYAIISNFLFFTTSPLLMAYMFERLMFRRQQLALGPKQT